jgi:wobble nucleotide-excising tRNase
LLGNYFNNEVDKLKDRIQTGVENIECELDTINNIKEIDRRDFYTKFAEQIKFLNLQIENVKDKYKTFLETLKTSLDNKLKNLFAKSNELSLTLPTNFGNIKHNVDKIIKENNEFLQNLSSEQEKAQNALRYHKIKMELETFKYDAEKQNLRNLDSIKINAQNELNNKISEFKQKTEEKNALILQTTDEKKIAEQINLLLTDMGFSSFSLELVNDTDENQKGQYKIKRWYHKENEFDNVENLSKGEKNIIAFLYFLFSLEKIGDDNKPKIVVLDDPITSNDDTMQYLMIGEIQKFYKKLTDDNFFILLTHNCHFYLNVRKQNDKFYEKYGNFHLFSDGKLTSTRVIENGNDDFKTNYEMLWKELLFLHEKDKPDLMLNSCRKICETYIKFNCKTDFYGDNVNAKKLFDVNLHSIDDLEAEQNGKTRDEIKDILKSLFEQNKAEEHFNAYWK